MNIFHMPNYGITYTYNVTSVFLAAMPMHFNTMATTINEIDGKGPNFELKNSKSYLLIHKYISHH